MLELHGSLEINKGQERVLKTLCFKADKEDADYFDSEIWYKESDENLMNQLCDIGIFQYRVTDWGHQEHGYFLTQFGQQIIRRYFNTKTR
jgi:hypothetical protein